MAMFFGMKKVEAEDIDAGASADGQVLTSDGAGNAAWEAAAGGGASFAFDGAIFEIGAIEGDGGIGSYYPVTMTLTLGGVAIEGSAVCWAYLMDGVGAEPLCASDYTLNNDGDGFLVLLPDASLMQGYEKLRFLEYVAPAELTVVRGDTGNDVTIYIYITLPSGAVLASAGMVFSAPPPL